MTGTKSSVDLGILGAGAIAEAIIAGLCEDPGTAPSILLSPRSRSRSQAMASRYPSVRVARDNQAVAERSRVVLLSLRPQDAGTVLRDIVFSPGQAVHSVIAGIPVASLRELCAPATRLARVIPLPAVARHRGLTAIYPPRHEAQALFDRLGGTIAAHFAYLATVSRWLTAQGISEADATRYVAATFAPLTETLSPPPADLMTLADAHATAGGINEQFCTALRRAGVFETVERSLDQIAARLQQHQHNEPQSNH